MHHERVHCRPYLFRENKGAKGEGVAKKTGRGNGGGGGGEFVGDSGFQVQGDEK